MANGNQSGFGTPGTQQTAQQNVLTGGVNPYMPVGQQLAKQGASSFQQSLVPGGPTPGVNLAKTAYSAAPAPPPLAKPSPLAGFPYKESLGLNASLGFSNVAPATMPGYVPGGGDLESSYQALSTWDERTEEEREAYRAKHGGMTKPEAITANLEEKHALGKTQGPSGEAIEGEQKHFPIPTLSAALNEYLESDQPGIDPEEYEKMQQANVDDAEMMYQQGLQALSRQYAMMGMTGSGAHMVANNAFGAQIHAQLIQAQNVLALENARIMEDDFAERFDNVIRVGETAISNAMKSGQIDYLDIQALVLEVGIINDQLGQNLAKAWEELGYEPTVEQLTAVADVIKTALSMDDPVAAAAWAAEQFAIILGETEVKEHKYYKDGVEVSHEEYHE